MYRLACAGGFLLLAFLSFGCTPAQNAPPPPAAPVKGTVTLDGKAMDGGQVRFSVPGQPPKSCTVKGGEFSGEGYVGKNIVEVVWLKDGPPSTTDPDSKTSINMVADSFQLPNTKLSADVAKEGASDLKFAVTSK